MAGAPPEPAAPADSRAFFEREILRWFPKADWLSSEARFLPDQMEPGERIEAVGVGSVVSAGGEIHGVVAITDRRVICQGFSRWARWECPTAAVTGYEPSSDDVTFYRVHADQAVIQVLRALGPQGELDAPMGRRFRQLAEQNASAADDGSARDSERSFTREILKRSMPS